MKARKWSHENEYTIIPYSWVQSNSAQINFGYVLFILYIRDILSLSLSLDPSIYMKTHSPVIYSRDIFWLQ